MSCSDAQVRRVEEASLNAWPALSQLLLDGWVVRLTRGFTKRANSVTPLYPGTLPVEAKIRQCERLYARANLRTIFRLPTIGAAGELDAALEARGYRQADPTDVLARPLDPAADVPACGAPPRTRVQALERASWLGLYARLTGQPAEASRLHALIVAAIPSPCLFLAAHAGEEAVACGLAVAEGELLGLFDVVTAPGHRRRGFAEAVVAAALARGAEEGARHAYLQVLEGNDAARRLYERLGFSSLYRYRYRIAEG